VQLIFLLLVLVLPLIFIPNISNPYEFPKYIFFVISTELLIVLFALHGLSNKCKKIFPKFDPGIIFVLSFGVITLTSDLFGVDSTVSIFGNNFRYQGFITLVSGIIVFILLRSPLLFKKIHSSFL